MILCNVMNEKEENNQFRLFYNEVIVNKYERSYAVFPVNVLFIRKEYINECKKCFAKMMNLTKNDFM
jgi:hypothetical protein